jgi:hypothetical protein
MSTPPIKSRRAGVDSRRIWQRGLRLACQRRIVGNAVRISLVVGTLLNAINQGGPLFAGEGVSWGQLVLNYLVPYCVANYSAVRLRLQQQARVGAGGDGDEQQGQ